MSDDDEGVVEFGDARFDVTFAHGCISAAKIANDRVVEGEHKADGRSALGGGLLIGGEDASV